MSNCCPQCRQVIGEAHIGELILVCDNSKCDCHATTPTGDGWDVRKSFIANFCDGDDTEGAHTFTFAGALDVAKFFYEEGYSRTRQEVISKLIPEERKHDSIVQLMVTDQGTPAGKLHYAREYGFRDGYNACIAELKHRAGEVK